MQSAAQIGNGSWDQVGWPGPEPEKQRGNVFKVKVCCRKGQSNEALFTGVTSLKYGRSTCLQYCVFQQMIQEYTF